MYSSKLTITNLRPEDSGEYRCIISNATGNIASSYSELIVRGMYIILCINGESNNFVYVIVRLAVLFGIDIVSDAGRKIVIVQGEAEHYYSFPACIMRIINSKY